MSGERSECGVAFSGNGSRGVEGGQSHGSSRLERTKTLLFLQAFMMQVLKRAIRGLIKRVHGRG